MSRQDRQGARTPADLEQKYKFGKSFAEVMGIALDAQKSVEEADAALKAELSLKLGYDENDKVISMINAASDVICLRSNRLIIESDKFSLDEDGTVSMRFSPGGDHEEYTLNTENHFIKLPGFEVARQATHYHGKYKSYTRIKSAQIGNVLFSTDNMALSPSIRFTDNGVTMMAFSDGYTSYSHIVVENNDGTLLYRLRFGEGTVFLESLGADNSNLDVNAFGISLRDILNRLKAVEVKVDIAEPEQCTHDNTYEQQENIPWCENYGEIGVYCSECGELVRVKYIEPLGHEYDDWGRCTRCGEIDPDYEGGGDGCLHEWDTETVLPTCTEDGFYSEFCKHCDLEYKTIYPALGHEWELADASGTLKVCRQCGATTTEVI
jgi:hypothetical protein